ncbi:hemerythrin domain-containing protein [Chloroflexota bacterium]
MNETLALIEQIIAEHKTVFKDLTNIDQVASDVQAINALEDASDTFMPGRHHQKEDLEKMKVLLDGMEVGLNKHFEREETGLLEAFRQYGDQAMVAGLTMLLEEHGVLKERLGEARGMIVKLQNGSLGGHQWAATAGDLRAYMGQTRRHLEAHAASEQHLLSSLRKILQAT